MRGYVLVGTEVGAARGVTKGLERIETEHCKILSVDTVTGQYDVIVQLEASSLDELGRAITEDVATINGVVSTLTCLVLNLS